MLQKTFSHMTATPEKRELCIPKMTGSPAIAFAKNHPRVLINYQQQNNLRLQHQNLMSLPLSQVNNDPIYLQRRLTEEAIAVCEEKIRRSMVNSANSQLSSRIEARKSRANSLADQNTVTKSEPRSVRQPNDQDQSGQHFKESGGSQSGLLDNTNQAIFVQHLFEEDFPQQARRKKTLTSSQPGSNVSLSQIASAYTKATTDHH